MISSVGYIDTLHHWSWVRRFKWKGRVHIGIQFNLPFIRVLRYDYMFDVAWISLFIYLQILAFIIARKISTDHGEDMQQKMHQQ